MEIIKGLATDYLLFSLWDSLVFYLFVNKLTKIKLKFVDALVVSAVFCLSSLAPPIARQIIGIIVIFAYIYRIRYYTNEDIKKVFYSLIVIALEYLYTLVINATFSLFYERVCNIDLPKLTNFKMFKYFIVIDLFEFIFIFVLRRLKMKQWWGSGVVRK
jgi:hypothetical protein|uniref:Uncharacterized protein n=1 Tax=Phage sp. ctGns7 TaxID=2828003 RepID=A0A8S5S981_9VIRU|nr:MAG TPA: hypothetical protein [Phage sp. ctGns7]